MKNSLLGLVALVGLVSALGAGGCGGVSAADVTASCNAYCDKYAAAACPDPTYPDAAACKADECGDTSGFSDDCREAAKAYYDCEKSQADICADTGCDSQAASLLTSCLFGG